MVLTVADTGSGIGEAHRSRVFEPFFSTRRRVGAGLGLATCYGIVTGAGGHIRLDSVPGGGTAAICAFPRAKPRVVAAPSVPASPASGQETVLVAEDEPMVREIVTDVLRDLGYLVIEAGDGIEALAAADAAPPITLLVTDVAMPRMGGRELGSPAAGTVPGPADAVRLGLHRRSARRRGRSRDGLPAQAVHVERAGDRRARPARRRPRRGRLTRRRDQRGDHDGLGLDVGAAGEDSVELSVVGRRRASGGIMTEAARGGVHVRARQERLASSGGDAVQMPIPGAHRA